MVILRNADYNRFLQEIGQKRIICFGAGGTLDTFLRTNAEKVWLFERIEAVLDNDPHKAGKIIHLCQKALRIENMNSFLLRCKDLRNFSVLLLLNDYILLDVIQQLDRFPQFDGVICYYGLSAIIWGNEINPPMPVDPILPKSSGHYEIPKVIHYCWFGPSPMGVIIEECINSWKKYCPDYELRFWNENNYDISSAPLYVRQAYEAGKYAFVSDYVRLNIVYKYGGFYLDTDVELFRSLNDFISYKAVFAYLRNNMISTGLGFGSVSKNSTIKEMMRVYERAMFLNHDGTQNLTDCPRYNTDCLRQKGFQTSNVLSLIEDTLFLPSSYLCALDLVECDNGIGLHLLYALTNSTYGIHKCASSWFTDELFSSFDSGKKRLVEINERLLNDWKRCLKGSDESYEKSRNSNPIL